MSDETSQAIVGDSVASAMDHRRGRKRRFWRRKPKEELAPLTHCENCGTESRALLLKLRSGRDRLPAVVPARYC